VNKTVAALLHSTVIVQAICQFNFLSEKVGPLVLYSVSGTSGSEDLLDLIPFLSIISSPRPTVVSSHLIWASFFTS